MVRGRNGDKEVVRKLRMNILLRKAKGHIVEPKLGICSTITGASPCNMSLKGVPVAKCFFFRD